MGQEVVLIERYRYWSGTVVLGTHFIHNYTPILKLIYFRFRHVHVKK